MDRTAAEDWSNASGPRKNLQNQTLLAGRAPRADRAIIPASKILCIHKALPGIQDAIRSIH